jgi:phthalate 4,5-cis-dihydrodiol dehydrogenase
MIPALVDHPHCRLAAAADPDPVLRARFAQDFACAVEADVGDLVRRSDVDAVYVATPHQLHKAHAVLAADHGKHVIVEKPMALTLEDCDAMIAAAERNGVVLIVGHTHGFDPAVGAMRDVVASGRLGRLAMIAMWTYTNFLYRPRRPEELDTSRGGGILFNQLPHQIDIARTVAGSAIRSVYAAAAVLDPRRPTEGCCTALLDFEDGVAASLVYSGYDRFDSDEFHGWVGENGQPKAAAHGSARRALAELADNREAAARAGLYGYGGTGRRVKRPGEAWHQPHFGLLIVSCEGGDMRPSKDGVLIYGDDGVSEITLPPSNGLSGRDRVLDELSKAVREGATPLHDGRFGRATLEACLAVGVSARERHEIRLGQQNRM